MVGELPDQSISLHSPMVLLGLVCFVLHCSAILWTGFLLYVCLRLACYIAIQLYRKEDVLRQSSLALLLHQTKRLRFK